MDAVVKMEKGKSSDKKPLTKEQNRQFAEQRTAEYNKVEATEANRNVLRDVEVKANVFSKMYAGVEENQLPMSQVVRHHLPMKPYSLVVPPRKKLSMEYRHWDGINFAAETRIWGGGRKPDEKENQKRIKIYPENVPTSEKEENPIRAYYRVIRDDGDKYTLLACHVNVHGFHRGDLRFVEVNDKTKVKGFQGKSVIGHLFLGDIVAVTKMDLISDKKNFVISAFKVNQESKATWQVSEMTILWRQFKEKMLFTVLDNGLAIAMGFNDEPFLLVDKGEKKNHSDELHRGRAFLPEKVRQIYAGGYRENAKNLLIAKASELPSYPSAFGTIYEHEKSAAGTAMFELGHRAFCDEKTEEEEDSNASLCPDNDLGYGYSDDESVGREIEGFDNDDDEPDKLTPAKTVETCALMGYAAANVILDGRFDCRSWPMIKPSIEGMIVRFSIDNPPKQPTAGLWQTNNRIKFAGKFGRENKRVEVNAVIETVIVNPERRLLNIAARISRGFQRDLNFKDNIFIVSQREPLESPLLRDGFFEKLKEHSNARRIITTLYGGSPITMEPGIYEEYTFPDVKNPVKLNKYQNEYVQMIIDGRTPMVVASAPFGCGKSMTIVTAALEKKQKLLGKSGKQLLITQSNYASVNLVDIARKCERESTDRSIFEREPTKFVRFVSESNWNEMTDTCRTEYDLPVLVRAFFTKFDLSSMPRTEKIGPYCTLIRYLISERILQPDSLPARARNIYNTLDRNEGGEVRPPSYTSLVRDFFYLYKPDVILSTADSLHNLLALKILYSREVRTIQIDEASQVPEYALLSLLVKFPNANFGLIGDTHQLPPYCEDDLTGKLKEYGIGNTMERAVQGELFPQSILRYVYRCHPKTTELLSELFYESKLLSGVTEEMRNEFIKNSEIWPNPDFPMIIVDNSTPGHRMGTSRGNKAEVTLVQQIVDRITKSRYGYSIPPEDVGVISFYSAQTSVLTEALRGSGVKCGTVDSFQGSEREVIILCCTNDKLSEFMQLPNRLNVAMSRARQATIIIGNVDGLRHAKYWSQVVKRVEEHRNLVDTSIYPFCLPESASDNNCKKKAEIEMKQEKKKKWKNGWLSEKGQKSSSKLARNRRSSCETQENQDPGMTLFWPKL